MNAHVPPRRDDEGGFTLVELVVVVLIVGVLMAIAFPVYLGLRSRTEDRATQSDLRSGLIAGLSYFTIGETYTGFDATEGSSAEPELSWIDGGAPVTGQVSIHVASGEDLLLVGRSQSGMYFCTARLGSAPIASFGSGAAFTDVDTIGECTSGW